MKVNAGWQVIAPVIHAALPMLLIVFMSPPVSTYIKQFNGFDNYSYLFGLTKLSTAAKSLA